MRWKLPEKTRLKFLARGRKKLFLPPAERKATTWQFFGAVYAMTGRIGKLTSLRTDEEGNSTGTKIPSAFGEIGHIVTTKFEHHAVLNSCKKLEKEGFEVTYLDLGKDGVVNPKDVAKALKSETVLVSIMYANNEIGTIQPIREIAKVIRSVKKKWGIIGSAKQNFRALPFR